MPPDLKNIVRESGIYIDISVTITMKKICPWPLKPSKTSLDTDCMVSFQCS